MSRVSQSASMSSCAGALTGLLLLGFAATLLVLTPSVVEDIGNARRLEYVDANGTLHHNSSFDSSEDSSASSGSASSFSSIGSSKSIESSSGSLRSSGARAEAALSALFSWAGTLGGQIFFSILFAIIYHSKAVAPLLEKDGTLADKDMEMTGEDDFQNGICGCFDDKWVCIHGLCCPLVRIAHTNAVAGVFGYWETAIAYLCCALISLNLGPCCLMIYWRRQVKEVMGIEDHMMNDILCTFFFPMLSLCQQATAVDRAMGYEVTGCCTLKRSRP